MSDDKKQPEQKTTKPQRYLYVLVAAERLNNHATPPSGWSLAEMEVDDKIKGELKFTVTEKAGKIKVDVEK